MSTTQQRILKTACLLFAEYGYDGVSMRQIADRAKVKPGTLHYHYATKETLYIEVFRKAYDIDNALTYEDLLAKEPQVLDTPEGKAYAIQRIVFDHFQRHLFVSEEWRKKLIYLEVKKQSVIFHQLVEECLSVELDKMIEFFLLLCPGGTEYEAYYWANIPNTQGIHYFMVLDMVDRRYGPDFKFEIRNTIIKNTTKTMIMLLDLPVPQMLE